MIIPSSRLIDWTPGTVVGVPGGIPNRSVKYNAVTDFGADPTGATDSKDAIQLALDWETYVGDAIYLPPGTYSLSGPLIPRANVSLRGARMGLTSLTTSSGGNGIVTNSGDFPDHTPTIAITSGATKGSTSVTVDVTTGAAVNKLITISALNPAWVAYDSNFYDVGPGDDGHDADRLLNSTHKITSISGSTINFSPPLPLDMTDTPMITPWTITLIGFGIEDLTIDLTGNSTLLGGVYLSQAYGCWVKGVEVINAPSRTLWFKKMVNSEVRQCYLHGSVGAGSNHEGLDLVGNDCFNLIEDNICINAGKPAIVVGDWGGGCCGNVIAYNYVNNANTSQAAEEYSISINHGPHNAMNLIEGNVCQSVKSDGYYGSSSHNTWFRNYVSGERPANVDFRDCVNYGRWSYYSNFVGNVLGTSGLGQIYEATHSNGVSNTDKWIWKIGYPSTGNFGFDQTVYTGTPTTPGYTCGTLANPQPGASRPDCPRDGAVLSSMIRHGNFDWATFNDDNEPDGGAGGSSRTPGIVWDPDIADHDVDALPSLYLPAKTSTGMAWGTLIYPIAFGHQDLTTDRIPAEYRYNHSMSDPPDSSAPVLYLRTH